MDSKKYEQMKNFVNSREPNTDNSMVNSLMEFAKELLEKNAALKAELDNQNSRFFYCRTVLLGESVVKRKC